MNPPNPAKLTHSSTAGWRHRLTAVALLTAAFSAGRLHANETNNYWIGTNGVSADILWTDPANWQNLSTNGNTAVAAGIPGLQGDVTLGNNGGTLQIVPAVSSGAPAGSALSVYGGGISVFTTNNLTSVLLNNQSIHWLFLCPTNNVGGMQNLYVTNGATLTVQGTDYNGMGPLGDYDNATAPNGTPTGGSLTSETDTLYVGRQSGTANSGLENNATQVTISGGGTLFLNNTNNQMQVRDCNSSGGVHGALLDMSALANFRANLARIKIGMGEQNLTDLRADATNYMAMTNTLVLSGTNSGELDNLVVGVNPENAGNATALFLGWTNGIYADTILVGGRKSGGAQMAFNPNFANPFFTNTQPTPTAYFRNHAGGPVTLFRVGDEFDGDASTVSSGTMDLSGGNANLSASTMIVGRGQNQGAGAETCILRMGEGVLNVGTLEFCSQGIAPVNDTVSVTADFIGTHITVTNSLQMVVPFSTAKARGLYFGMSSDSNGVPATLTSLGTVTTGYITEHNTLDSGVIYGLTNSTIALVNPQPIEASTMILSGGAISNASYILITGNSNSVTINNAYGSSLTVLNNGQFLGSPVFDLGVRTATWDVSGIGGPKPGSLVVSNLLEGIGTIEGGLVQAPGATIQVGVGTAAGTLAIDSGSISNLVPGNVTLNNGDLQFGLSTSGTGSGNDSLSVQGTLTLLGTNQVTLTSLNGSFDTVNPYTLITSSSALPAGAANYFQASGALGGSRYTLTFDTTTQPNNVLLHVGGAGPANDTWVGGLNGNAWDVKTTANWNTGEFYDLDNVTFSDSGSASPAINIVGSLIPGSMTVSTTNKNYAFAGTGSIFIGGAFTANGFGSLTFSNSGGVNFQDTLTIASNNVVLGGNGQYSIAGDPNSQIGLTLNGGSVTLAGNSTTTFVNPVFAQTMNINSGTVSVVNSNANVFNGSTINLVNTNSVFVFGQPASVSALCDATFSGSGQIIQNGPGLISLSGVNSGLSGVTVVNGGTLQTQVGTAAGGMAVLVNSGGTLDLFGQSLGAVPVTASGFGVGGQGVVVSSSGTGGAFTSGLTLLANSSVGGTPVWSFDPVQNRGLLALSGSLTASTVTGNTTNAFNLIKVGGNELQYNFSPADPNLAAIDVQGGMLYLTGSGGLGNATNTITAESGATIALAGFSDSEIPANNGIPTKVWILNGDGADPTLLDYGISQTAIGGPVTLNGACLMEATPASRVNDGSLGVAAGVEIQGPISGTGSFSMPGPDTWILAGTNTYTGNTTVSGGTLELSGTGCVSNSAVISIQNEALIDATERNDQTLTLNGGQTLATLDGGNVNGNLTTVAGSTVAPGGAGSLDVLSVANGNITLGGVTSMKLDPMLAGLVMDSDQLDATNGSQTIEYGGTLALSNFGGSYAIGQTFQLFNATNGTYSGAFTSITPAQPGSGLAWDTSALLTTGTIGIKAGAVTDQPATIRSVSISGSTITLSGTGGADDGRYIVLTSTNLALPLAAWSPVLTNNYAGNGSFTVTLPVTAGSNALFYMIESY